MKNLSSFMHKYLGKLEKFWGKFGSFWQKWIITSMLFQLSFSIYDSFFLKDCSICKEPMVFFVVFLFTFPLVIIASLIGTVVQGMPIFVLRHFISCVQSTTDRWVPIVAIIVFQTFITRFTIEKFMRYCGYYYSTIETRYMPIDFHGFEFVDGQNPEILSRGYNLLVYTVVIALVIIVTLVFDKVKAKKALTPM